MGRERTPGRKSRGGAVEEPLRSPFPARRRQIGLKAVARLSWGFKEALNWLTFIVTGNV